MVDSKLVLSKILESMDSEKVKYKTSKEDVEECVNARMYKYIILKLN